MGLIDGFAFLLFFFFFFFDQILSRRSGTGVSFWPSLAGTIFLPSAPTHLLAFIFRHSIAMGLIDGFVFLLFFFFFFFDQILSRRSGTGVSFWPSLAGILLFPPSAPTHLPALIFR